jgi:osomolarity two-component system sensor histidine kinase SLN1
VLSFSSFFRARIANFPSRLFFFCQGVYNSQFVLSLRAESLEVIATLKASQVLQVLNTLYYQAYLLSIRDSIKIALTKFRAGNASPENWSTVSTIFNSTFGTSQNIISASIFDLTGTLAFNISSIPDSVYPRDLYSSLRGPDYTSIIKDSGVFIAGPQLNPSDSSFLMSMTLPVLTNSTIFVDTNKLSGYITLIFQASGLNSIINDSIGLNVNGRMYLVGADNVTNLNDNNIEDVQTMSLLLPSVQSDYDLIGNYPISAAPAVGLALNSNLPGSVLNSQAFGSRQRAVGYALVKAYSAIWVVLISETHKSVYESINKLRNITLIAGSCVLVVCVLVIVGCVHVGVQPIYRLKQAAEQTTLLFHQDKKDDSSVGDTMSTPPGPPPEAPSLRQNLLFWKPKLGSRNSQISSDINMTPTHSNTCPGTLNLSPVTIVSNSSYSGLSNSNNTSINKSLNTNNTVINPVSNSATTGGNDSNKTSGINSNKQYSTATNGIVKTTSPEPERRLVIPARVRVREYKYFTDELVSLQYSFNSMADELEKQYNHLEDIVKERTKELEAARIQAETANEAKSAFIANITHELRTPLNGILGMTAVSMTEEDPEKVKRSLKVISKSGLLLLNLLNDLLTFSKNQIGNIVIEEKEFVIDEIITQLELTYGGQAQDKKIAFEYEIEPHETYKNMILFGDSGRILHILLNIVSNCLKFSPKGSKIKIKFRCSSPPLDPEEEMTRLFSQSSATSSSQASSLLIFEEPKPCTLILEVEDEGPGVDPSKVEKLFEPFVQGDQALSRRHGGAGLGLSICNQLVGLMGGSIVLKNSITKGLIVKVALPIKQTRKLASSSNFKKTVQALPSQLQQPTPSSQLALPSASILPLPPQLPLSRSLTRQSSMQSSRSSLVDMPERRTSISVPQPEQTSYFDKRPNPAHRKTATTLITVKALSTTTASTTGGGEHQLVKILIVEDNIINQEIMKRMVTLQFPILFPTTDLVIDLAVNGEQAVAKIEEAIRRGFYYKVVFMDIQMPRMDGLQATRIIRTQLGYVYPIIALTAYVPEDSDSSDAMKNMDGVLEKPVDMNALKAILEKFVEFKAYNASMLGTPSSG